MLFPLIMQHACAAEMFLNSALPSFFMEELLKLAEQIADKDLKDKTKKFLKDLSISCKSIHYSKADIEKAPAWIGAHHDYEGGLKEHTISVTKLSLLIAEHFEKTYKKKVNKDFIIAGALLHDIMKVFLLKKSGGLWTFTGSLLDHAFFSAAELYARGFPEEVIHIVAAHGGDTCAASPRTIEAAIVYYADVLDSSLEFNINKNLEDIIKAINLSASE